MTSRIAVTQDADFIVRAYATSFGFTVQQTEAYVGKVGLENFYIADHEDTPAAVFALIATGHWFGFNADDVWSLFHSYAFDFSVWEIWGALLYGGRLIVVPYEISRSPKAFRSLLHHEGVTVLNQTPSAFRALIDADLAAGDASPLALRWVIFGGEALDPQTLMPWFERHGDSRPRLVNMYGITETTVHVTYRAVSYTHLTLPTIYSV